MAKQVKIDIVARDKTKQAIDKSKRGLGGLKTAALAVSAALATIGAGRALKGLVNTGKEIESLQIRFKLLFGSAEEGAKAFDEMAKFGTDYVKLGELQKEQDQLEAALEEKMLRWEYLSEIVTG